MVMYKSVLAWRGSFYKILAFLPDFSLIWTLTRLKSTKNGVFGAPPPLLIPPHLPGGFTGSEDIFTAGNGGQNIPTIFLEDVGRVKPWSNFRLNINFQWEQLTG